MGVGVKIFCENFLKIKKNFRFFFQINFLGVGVKNFFENFLKKKTFVFFFQINFFCAGVWGLGNQVGWAKLGVGVKKIIKFFIYFFFKLIFFWWLCGGRVIRWGGACLGVGVKIFF